jgi:dihydroxyacetone kinase-like protein
MTTLTTIDAACLRATFFRWADAMERAAPELNELDSRMGDGDLGVTLAKCAEKVRIALTKATDTVPDLFNLASNACAEASGSSFGTLMASGLLTASKWLENGKVLDKDSLPELLKHVVQKLCLRGGASLGDKTMLDALQAIAISIEMAPPGQHLAEVARSATAKALDEFRFKPNRVGRARMFADKSVGLDDPGMVAVLRMTQIL